jgi:hypothetical protein
MTEKKYIGWIPCINGHLDFGLMKVGISGGFTNLDSTDNNFVSSNFSCSDLDDSHQRRIVLQSKVDWRDTPKFESGDFRVIVTAEVSLSSNMDKRNLTGYILIYPEDAEPKTKEMRSKMNVHALSHSIKVEEEPHTNFNALEKITSGKDKISGFDEDFFSCSFKFTIEPNGLIILECCSDELNDAEASKFIIARQAFYYLKYSIHMHKHHANKQDSLTTITELDSKEEAGLRLICQLKRELTGLKRDQHTDRKSHPTNNALGIIAYINSLIISLEESKYIGSEITEREKKRFKDIKASFTAQTSKIQNEVNNSELVKSKSKVWLGFSIISMWSFCNFFLKVEDTSKPTTISEESSKIFISPDLFFYIPLFGFIISILIYMALKYSYKQGLIPEENEKLYLTKYSSFIWRIALPIAALAFICVEWL